MISFLASVVVHFVLYILASHFRDLVALIRMKGENNLKEMCWFVVNEITRGKGRCAIVDAVMIPRDQEQRPIRQVVEVAHPSRQRQEMISRLFVDTSSKQVEKIELWQKGASATVARQVPQSTASECRVPPMSEVNGDV